MHLLTGYRKPVLALAASPDGSRLYTAAEGQTLVWEWDVGERQVLRKLRSPHTAGIAALACSPDGTHLASVSDHHDAVLWVLRDLEQTQLRMPQSTAHVRRPALAFRPDSLQIAAPVMAQNNRYGFQTWDVPDGKAGLSVRDHSAVVLHLAYSHDGARLATVSEDGTARLWDMNTGTQALTLRHQAAPTRVSFRSDRLALACASGWAVCVWDLATGTLEGTFKVHKGRVNGLAYSPDGQFLASAATDGCVVLRDARTLEQIGLRNIEIGKLSSLLWLPGHRLVVGGDGRIAICELDDLRVQQQARTRARQEPLSLAGHTKVVQTLAYSPDGRSLASAAASDLRLWDLSGGAGQARPSPTFAPRYVYGFMWSSWSPAGLLTVQEHDSLCFYDLTGQIQRQLPLPRTARCLAWSPSGLLLCRREAAGCTRLHLRVALVHPETGDEVASASFDTTRGGGLTYAKMTGPDHGTAYLGTSEGEIYHWSPPAGTVESVGIQGTQLAGLALSPDWRWLATAGGHAVYLWPAQPGESGRPRELRHPHTVTGLAFCPDGRLVTSCFDRGIRLWDVGSGQEMQSWDLGMGRIYSLAVSPDGMTCAAGVQKGSRIVLLDIPD